MSYDNWKLQTPPESSRGLYADEYERKIEELAENESTVTEMIVQEIERIKKVKNSDSIAYTSAGGNAERQKDLKRFNHKLNYLKAFQEYIINEINKYQSYLEE